MQLVTIFLLNLTLVEERPQKKLQYLFSKSALMASDETKEQFGTTVCLMHRLLMSTIMRGVCSP